MTIEAHIRANTNALNGPHRVPAHVLDIIASADHWLDRLCDASAEPERSPRVAVVVAHPDDEVIGAGSRLPKLHHAAVVSVTDGAPRDMHDAIEHGFATRDDYARARRQERAAALALAGADPSCVHELGVVDQEASRALVDVALDLEALLVRLQPDVVLTHAYEGGHPDHDAVAFAVHAAVLRMLYRRDRAPAVLEFASYHACDGQMVTGVFTSEASIPERAVHLSHAERALKQRMYDCFVTQRRVLAHFRTDVERFRTAPRYDFSRPPGTGSALYDSFEWGMRSSEWRDLAGGAWERLNLAHEQ